VEALRLNLAIVKDLRQTIIVSEADPRNVARLWATDDDEHKALATITEGGCTGRSPGNRRGNRPRLRLFSRAADDHSRLV
jgi:hypothetical protein